MSSLRRKDRQGIFYALGASLIVISGLFLIYREHVRHRDITAVIIAHGGFDRE